MPYDWTSRGSSRSTRVARWTEADESALNFRENELHRISDSLPCNADDDICALSTQSKPVKPGESSAPSPPSPPQQANLSASVRYKIFFIPGILYVVYSSTLESCAFASVQKLWNFKIFFLILFWKCHFDGTSRERTKIWCRSYSMFFFNIFFDTDLLVTSLTQVVQKKAAAILRQPHSKRRLRIQRCLQVHSSKTWRRHHSLRRPTSFWRQMANSGSTATLTSTWQSPRGSPLTDTSSGDRLDLTLHCYFSTL